MVTTPSTLAGDVADVEPEAQPLLDDQAVRCIVGISAWMRAHARDYSQEIQTIRVRRWQSIEEPAHVEVVIEPRVVGETEAALRFWEDAGQELDRLTAAEPTPATDRLTLHLDWVDGGWS